LYDPGVVGAVPVQVYDPSVGLVVAVAMFVFQLNTHTIGSFPNPPPLAVRAPETENDVPSTVDPGGTAVSEVKMGLDSVPLLRFKVIVPGPFTETEITLLEPEHDNPLIQFQLAIE